MHSPLDNAITSCLKQARTQHVRPRHALHAVEGLDLGARQSQHRICGRQRGMRAECELPCVHEAPLSRLTRRTWPHCLLAVHLARSRSIAVTSGCKWIIRHTNKQMTTTLAAWGGSFHAAELVIVAQRCQTRRRGIETPTAGYCATTQQRPTS
ncbi:hypothetical protein L917_04230 [Phytophthora nicotianae]|uniref:Uncharacterized protein n=1 Tax=Phytophthora nicotianae TaxID=4792 RepID=W2LN03_PHYNI|nr:hypothetical protein L917_04230 [Phytophthora nicotianae]